MFNGETDVCGFALGIRFGSHIGKTGVWSIEGVSLEGLRRLAIGIRLSPVYRDPDLGLARSVSIRRSVRDVCKPSSRPDDYFGGLIEYPIRKS